MSRADWGWLLAAVVVALLIVGFATVVLAAAAREEAGWRQCGMASWYGSESGRVTANGERFNPEGMTAAHRRLPFGTRVRVTDMATGRSVVVRVSDRGPARWTHRIIDLSRGAARRLGMIERGTARVCLTPQTWSNPPEGRNVW